MVELATVIYEESRRRLTALFDEETDQQIAFLGGVQVNTPAHMDDYFVIHHFEVRRKVGGKDVVPGGMAATATMDGVCSYVYTVVSRRPAASGAGELALKVIE